jgi:dipeptidyl-peptidase-3
MKLNPFFYTLLLFLFSCENAEKNTEGVYNQDDTNKVNVVAIVTGSDGFVYQTEQFSDLRILRYQVPGFKELPVKQKELLYYLYEAALCGRDIMWDQNYKYNLIIRKTIENICNSYTGDKNSDGYKNFLVYAKRVWFSNGIHHHYSSDKITPECTKEFFLDLIKNSDQKGFSSIDIPSFNLSEITTIIFDTTIAPKRISLDAKTDMLQTSSMNLYEGISQADASAFYQGYNKNNGETPVMAGLNSKLLKENGKIFEKKWMVGGMYTLAIEKIVFWLEKASAVAESAPQKDALNKLITFYKTGELKDFDTYCISWVKDNNSIVDVVNGFIETYGDPLGFKGDFESVVSVKDMEASKRISAIGNQAQWFEDNSPLLPEHKKKNVKGISAKVINVVIESGGNAPATPIGINLPNNEWIREKHGSKSVNLGNIVEAYDQAAGSSVVDEFYFTKEIATRVKKCAPYADKLHTDMHEVIGHASGQIEKGVGQPSETLKNYASTLEEARADLVALYYLYDKKLVEMGIMDSLEYGKASYDEYITKGLLIQMSRLKLGKDLEEAHMRNRQLVAAWVYEKGKNKNVIERKNKNGKTFFVVNDYNQLKVLFGDLLREIQRIKSKGDYNAGKNLVENYGVIVDKNLHKEVLDRYTKLGIAPYAGFIQPKLIPIIKEGKILDVEILYPLDFATQMLEYGKNYGLLPAKN